MPTEPRAALLRSPPFPWADAGISAQDALKDAATAPEETAALFTLIRDARVGGDFWLPGAQLGTASSILRPRPGDDLAALLRRQDLPDASHGLWLLQDAPTRRASQTALPPSASSIFTEVDPWSLLDGVTPLVAHGDDDWAALAAIAGNPVHFLSAGRYGHPDASIDERARLTGDHLRAAAYRSPFTQRQTSIAAAITQLAEWRRLLAANREIAAACGIAWWKRKEIARLLWAPDRPLRFFRSERRAITHAARTGRGVAVWPSRISATMVALADAKAVPLVRIEDGFVRSVGLGAQLVPPSSITADRRGIHYDPTTPSDLEHLLATEAFPPSLLARARQLRTLIVERGISKYGVSAGQAGPQRSARRLVLVPGQVEDDRSVLLGGGGLTSNLELLKRVRLEEPESEIWFRPHPDVDSGHRRGMVRDSDALCHADRIVRGGSMAGLLDQVDGVHVLTSLTGFEALLRGRDVTCHGLPFYAGWGLTRDIPAAPGRRTRRLTLDELVAGVLILYPLYLDPVTLLPCPPETLIARMVEGEARNRLGWLQPVRILQGKLTRRVR